LVLLLLGVFPAWMGLRNGPSRARKARPAQVAELLSLLDSSSGHALDIDWMRYKDVAKQELIDHAAARGWRYAGQRQADHTWLLSFTFDSGPPPEDAAARLADELTLAEVDATGRYVIDADQYRSLPGHEQREVITAAGWEPVSGMTAPSEFLVVTKPDIELSDGVGEPKLVGIRPHEFRRNPAVVERARRFQQEHGIDPLAPENLDDLRRRNNRWLKRFLAPAVLSGLLLAAGPFPLVIGMTEFDSPAAVSTGWTMLAVGTALGLIAAWIRARRRQEIGAYLKLLPELRRIHAKTGPHDVRPGN